MTMTRAAMTLTAVAGTTLMLIAGCSSSGGGKPTDSPTSTLTSSATSPSVAPPSSSSTTPAQPSSAASSSPAEIAASQVTAFLATYYATLDGLAGSATSSLNGLDSITTDAKNSQEKTTLAEYRANGWLQRGSTKLVTSKVTSLDLTKTATARPTVHVTTCLDLTSVKEVDKTGKSVTLPTRPNFLIEQLTVVNINYPSAAGWRVSDAPNKGAASCAGV